MYYMPPRWEGGMSSADELRIDPARGPRAAAALAVELALEKSSDRKLSMLHVHDTVFSAVDAEIGLTIAHAELPNLILMDIQLPGMDGLEATALLRAHDATRAIPVIALTALAMNGDEAVPGVLPCGAQRTVSLARRYWISSSDVVRPLASNSMIFES